MVELTPEQRQELQGHGPVEVRDPLTDTTYVWMRDFGSIALLLTYVPW